MRQHTLTAKNQIMKEQIVLLIHLIKVIAATMFLEEMEVAAHKEEVDQVRQMLEVGLAVVLKV